MEWEEFYQELYQRFPLLLEVKDQLELFWNEALLNLDAEDQKAYLQFLEQFQPRNITEFILFFYFLHSGCFYMNLKYRDISFKEFGVMFSSKENFFIKQKEFTFGKIQIVLIFPQRSDEILPQLLKKEFYPTIKRIMVRNPIFLSSNYFDYIEIAIDYIDNIIKPYLQKNIPVCISHFKFEQLQKYTQNIRIFGLHELVLEIDKVIRSKFKKRDIGIALSYDSYLVVSVNARKDVIYQRFKNLFIEVSHVSHLVLDYELFIEELSSPNDSVREVLLKLKV
ncbi:MAG: hypothetical protein NZ853_02360 [Leptospiraceae bacterium]|nr:hypothetical protein [Leptospiraceae bacterium]MDW7975022.1 hypothetical protein [Leptospiraceae bacterium]